MADDTYENALERDGRDLTALARRGELPAAELRDAEVSRVIAELDARRSVVLHGPPGAGKTTIACGVAQLMNVRKNGRLLELTTALLLSGTRYIGEWETKVVQIARRAERQGIVIYLRDLWNLPVTGLTSNTRGSVLDAWRPFLETGRLRILGEATPQNLRSMQAVPGFMNLFVRVDVPPLEPPQVDSVLRNALERAGVSMAEEGRNTLVSLTSRFLSARAQPGPALKLLEQVLDYQKQKRGVGEDDDLSRAFIERVFSINCGLPRFIVSPDVTIAAAEIRNWFRDRIVGQEDAIEAVIEAIALFKAGLRDPTKPIGTFLFVGPTGVGKTELARAPQLPRLAARAGGSARRQAGRVGYRQAPGSLGTAPLPLDAFWGLGLYGRRCAPTPRTTRRRPNRGVIQSPALLLPSFSPAKHPWGSLCADWHPTCQHPT